MGTMQKLNILPPILLQSNNTGQRLKNIFSMTETVKTYVLLVVGEMVCGQHSDSQARAQRCIQEAADDCLVLQERERKCFLLQS